MVNSKLRSHLVVIVGVMMGLLLVSYGGPSTAIAGSTTAETTSSGDATDSPLSRQEVASASTDADDAVMLQLIREVEKTFTRYVPLKGNRFEVNREALTADGLATQIAGYESMAAALNQSNEGVSARPSKVESTQDWNGFANCLIGGTIGVSFTTMPGLVRAIITGVRAWNWGLVASTVLRIVGPIALRSIGGPAGFAAALAAAAGGCWWENLRSNPSNLQSLSIPDAR